MALINCVRVTGLQCFQRQLLRASITGTSNAANTGIQSNWKPVVSSQMREYRKFSRVPIAVRPAKQDQGKILATDYVDSSVEELTEIKAEAARLATLLQNNTKSAVNNGNSIEEPHITNEKAYKHSRKGKVLPDEGTIKEANKKKLKTSTSQTYWEPDPEIRAALKTLHPELFINAPSYFRQLLGQCSSTKLRHQHDVVMLESPKLVREAISAGLTPAAVYTSRKKLLLDMMPNHMHLQEKVERLLTYNIFTTPFKKLNTWSSVVQAQGLSAVFRLSEAASAPRLKLIEASESQPLDTAAPASALTVVLDGVSEPGNMGAIIRTVAAVGAKRLVLIKGCCDPWEGKALRAGCGGHFSLDIVSGVSWDAIYSSVPACPAVYVADVCNSDREPITYPLQEEGKLEDLPEEGKHLEEATPDNDDDDEELRHQLRREKNDEKRKLKRAEAHDDVVITVGNALEVDEDGHELLLDHSFNDVNHVNGFAEVSLPYQTYNEITFYPPGVCNSASCEEVVLLIGSETGISNSAKKFASDNLGRQVSIPLQNGIDSLNTSVAAGIILYEIWNQALMARQAGMVATAVRQE